MSDDAERPDTPIPHDGYHSRTFRSAAIVWGLCFVGTGIAVAVGKATFAEAASFQQWLTPTLWGLAYGKLGLDKFAQVKRA